MAGGGAARWFQGGGVAGHHEGQCRASAGADLSGPTHWHEGDSRDHHAACGGDVGEIRNIVGFHIRLAYGAVYRHFTETFAHLDLTQKQVSVLWLVDDHPGIAQTGLAQRMRMDRATTMAIVNRLQSKG